MIKGIGTDIELISRIQAAMEKDVFLSRFFSENEIEYFKKRNNAAQTVAGCFCAKEAVSKALGTGFSGFSLKDIEVLHDDFGKPYIRLFNGAQQIYESLSGNSIQVSISHSKDNAIAFAVIE